MTIFLEERESGKTWMLHRDRIYTIGRNLDRDIRFDVPQVSRHHAEIFWDGTTWCLRDCDSSYGTYIQERSIREQQLHPQQWFRLGSEAGVTLRLIPEPRATANTQQEDIYYPPQPPSPPFNWEDFRGHGEMRSQLKDYADLILDAQLNQPVQGILLLGKPGRGKRFLCRCLADRLTQEREQTFNFISRDLSETNNLYQAGRLIYRGLRKATENAPTIVLLENFDLFYRYLQQAETSDGHKTGDTTWWMRFWGTMGIADLASETEKARRLKDKLDQDLETYWQWNQHEKRKIIILATANNLSLLPPEVREPGKVFSFILAVPQHTIAARVAILEKYLYQLGTPLAKELNLTAIAQQLDRIEITTIEQIVKQAESFRYESGANCLKKEHFEPFLPPSPATIWQQLMLPENVLQPIKQWANNLRQWDIANPQLAEIFPGILITGTPGTGKSKLAQLLAEAGKWELVTLTPGKIASPLAGQSVKNLQAIFTEARAQAPAVLLIDDIEGILPRKEERGGDPSTAEVINQFLQEVDRLDPSTGVILVATTNKPENIEPTVLARFLKQIALPLPDLAQRVEMLRYFTTENQRQILELGADVDLNYYGQLLVGKSGREIEAIAKRIIGKLGADQLTLHRKHFDSVLLPKISGELTGIILPQKIITELTRTLAQFLQALANPLITPPAGLLLSGAPGTGKTEIARQMAKLGGIKFQGVDARDIRDKFVGESNRKLAEIFAQARRNVPAIIFFDEIDSLFPSRDEHSAQHEIELVNQFLQEVDGVKTSGRGIFIIGATNRPEQLDPAVRSRLSKTIAIPLPELSERIELLKLFVAERPITPDLDWQAVALLLTGKSGRAIKAKVEEAYHLACQENSQAQIELKHFQQALLWTGDNANIPELVLPVPMMERVEQTLATLKNLPQALSLGLPLPKGMLLTGLPGTGKTQIARYLAAKAGWFFRAVSPSDVRSTYQGGSVKNLQTIFNDARDRAPCILFFDEIDSLFPRRENNGSNQDVELVNEFLQQVDGATQSAVGIFLLGATNRADAVDSAVVSRIQQTLEVPLPGVRERRIMLERALAQKNWQLASAVDLEVISCQLEGKSGRDIQGVLTRVGQAFVQRQGWKCDRVILTHEDFDRALLPPVEIDESAWDKLILSAEIKQTLQTNLERFLRFFREPIAGVTPAKGMLLHGSPGTGKTQVARVLAKVAGCRFMDLSIAEVRSQYVGEAGKKLTQTFERARREAPTILFIDEIDALLPQREGNVSQYEIEIINQFLQELDGFRGGATGVFVVGATNYVDRVDNAVRSRLNKIIEIPLPAQPERVAMLRLFTKEMPLADNFDWEQIARLLQGKSGRDIRQLVSEVGQYASDNLNGDRSLVITTEDFLNLLESKAPQGELTWNDVILPQKIKSELQRLVKLVANYAHLPPGISPPKGALLYGQPGTGKTQIARVMASVSGLYFKSYAPADIRSQWVGQNSRNLADIFQKARQQAPAILFFDEIESLFPNRGELGTTAADLENQNLVNQFLQEVDGVRTQAGYVFVLGATNFPENVDSAVRSRLQREIAIPLPEIDQIQQILKTKIHPEWLLDRDVDLLAYAQILVGRSGRDIATGVETAAQLAFDDWMEGKLVVSDRHFRQAFGLFNLNSL